MRHTALSVLAAATLMHASPGIAQTIATTHSTITTRAGTRLAYQAEAGTIAVTSQHATADMSYVSYVATKGSRDRPIVFLFNGGPGASSVWLHMGAFGPKRVDTPDPASTIRPPYRVVANPDCLLDAADLVFVDAPGTGFGRLEGPQAEHAFFGVDQDVDAFADFIERFLRKTDRHHPPLFLFGESYGTPRAAILADTLEEKRRIDVNGVILMSQALNFDLVVDHASGNPGVDMPYVLGLPSYTATAWYHHKLPVEDNVPLERLLAEVRSWSMDTYLPALAAGAVLEPARRAQVVAKLHDYTGLSAAYIDRANLRVEAGQFLQELGADDRQVYGRLDTRYAGPTMDPLEEEASYDPQTAAIAASYEDAWESYATHDLHLASSTDFVLQVEGAWSRWNWRHVQPNVNEPVPGALNAMGDLAAAMEFNPALKVMLNSGYFDVATPFSQGLYELAHLPMPAMLQRNITAVQYRSGHKIFVDAASLTTLHDNIARFIEATTTRR